VCWFGAPSLTRGRVCRLQLLLALASAVILGSESLGTRDHILLSHIRDFPFRRLLRLAGLWWRYSTPPPHGSHSCEWITCPFMTRCEPQTEHTLERFICCYLLIRWHGNACSPEAVVQQNLFRVARGMCSAKRHPADGHILAFRRHVTIFRVKLPISVIFLIRWYIIQSVVAQLGIRCGS
jgi:hypothetical protein